MLTRSFGRRYIRSAAGQVWLPCPGPCTRHQIHTPVHPVTIKRRTGKSVTAIHLIDACIIGDYVFLADDLSKPPDQWHKADRYQAHQQCQGKADAHEIHEPVSTCVVNHKIGLVTNWSGKTG